MAIVIGNDIALTGVVNQRPTQVVGNPYANRSAGPLQLYLNPDAFKHPATGTLGNLGRNSIVGPGTWQWDLAISRLFKIQESKQIEFRAEAFNVPNSFRPADLNTTSTTTTSTTGNGNNVTLDGTFFGQIRGSLDPRIMQFALKYIF